MPSDHALVKEHADLMIHLLLELADGKG